MIILVVGAKHPPFYGVIIPCFPLAEILVNERLHYDRHERESRIVMVAV